jgi:hypothetical protein
MVAVTLFLLSIVSSATAKYSGGTGEPNDPYQIATAAELIALGETPADYDKHFILTADIDLDPNVPGRKVFDKAVIAPDTDPDPWDFFQGTTFTGVFDGNRHTISHLTVTGESYLGLFGQLGSGGEVRNLGVVDVNITAAGHYIGGLVGWNCSDVTNCFSAGTVSGDEHLVGGLVGENGGSITTSYSTGSVSGAGAVGGLVGGNEGSIAASYSTASVSGESGVGGLVGGNGWGSITQCYSAGVVSGKSAVGGLAGRNEGFVAACFWDIQTSGQARSDGGIGKTTAEMQTPGTFAGWGACGPFWIMNEGLDYPHLAWEDMPGDAIDTSYGGGTGTAEDPYLIYTPKQLNTIGLAVCAWDKHFKLMADIDLSGFDGKDGRPAFNAIGQYYWPEGDWEPVYYVPGPPFTGVFDGNGHTISHLTIEGETCVAMFVYLASGAEIKNLGVVDVNATGTGAVAGGLVAYNERGSVSHCYGTGVVRGAYYVGGLVGCNAGTVTNSYAVAKVVGDASIGGLVGANGYWRWSMAGPFWVPGATSNCYSTGAVIDGKKAGGLVGRDVYFSLPESASATVTSSFWDSETSGQTTSAGGTGKTTAEMQTAKTFLDAGWDFVGETANGTEDIWGILEGKDYPKLWWELNEQKTVNP